MQATGAAAGQAQGREWIIATGLLGGAEYFLIWENLDSFRGYFIRDYLLQVPRTPELEYLKRLFARTSALDVVKDNHPVGKELPNACHAVNLGVLLCLADKKIHRIVLLEPLEKIPYIAPVALGASECIGKCR